MKEILGNFQTEGLMLCNSFYMLHDDDNNLLSPTLEKCCVITLLHRKGVQLSNGPLVSTVSEIINVMD